MTNLADCALRDAQDPLRQLRDLFELPQGVIYLDGNSLGALPRTAAARVAEVVTREWGQGLIRSWNTAGWIGQPQLLGDKIARLIGARPGEVIVADSTSINLYKVLSVALQTAARQSPGRKIVLSERSNFPTDLYIAQGLCQSLGFELKLAESRDMAASVNADVAVLLLTHVNYRTGAMYNMAGMTRLAHQAGALAVWDLAHSAGAVPVDLNLAKADFAIGCGYKFLNGGPGAPAFVWANPLHTQSGQIGQPLQGWMGHAAPFTFNTGYSPAAGIRQYLCGTPSVLGMAALDCGLDTLLAAEPLGGMAALRAKSLALTDLFMALVEQHCAGHGLETVTPREHGLRGSQVSLCCKAPVSTQAGQGEGGLDAHAVMQALIARGVIGDFRTGDGGAHADILRFGFTPLYTRFVDVWNAVAHLREVIDSAEWRAPQFHLKQTVT